jgi:phosphate transport system substrate-binding protein
MAASVNAQANASPHAGSGYALPDGSIQIVAQRDLVPLMEQLDVSYAQSHVGVRFNLRGGDNYSAMAALSFDVSAFAPMTSEFTRIGLSDNLKISPEPTAFRIAHASLKPGTLLSPLAVVVNKANTLTGLTIDQLTRIFVIGAPRNDITRWSQLGIKGALVSRDIHPCGPPVDDSFAFDDPQVGEFLGTGKFNGLHFSHTYTQLPHYSDIVSRVAEDPAAIGIATLNSVTPEVRIVAIASNRASQSYTGTMDDIAAGRYPLDRYVYIYLRSNPAPAAGFDPFANEYMRFVLSPEGQRIIAASGAGYIPLNPREAADELAKIQQ